MKSCSLFLQASIARNTHKTLEHTNEIKGYKRNDHQFCSFKNYCLTYTQYSKCPKSQPSSPKADQWARPII